MKQSKKGHRTPKLRARANELRSLKETHGLTYELLHQITGYHAVSLRQWGSARKPLKENTIRSIRLMIAEYAKTNPPQSA